MLREAGADAGVVVDTPGRRAYHLLIVGNVEGDSMNSRQNGPTCPSHDLRRLEVLELRVHGVRNSPPSTMLASAPNDEIPVEEIEPAVGDDGVRLCDDLAGFYRRKADGSSSEPTCRRGWTGRRRRVPAVHQIEAYSWGNLSRIGLRIPVLGTVGRVVNNLGWFTVAPFGFANAAYWTLVITESNDDERKIRSRGGGGFVRVYGLLLTLLLVASISTVAFDLVAIQCVRPGQQGSGQVCAALPSFIDGLRNLDRGKRLVMLSVLPLLALTVVLLLSKRTSVRFRTRHADAERIVRAGEADQPGAQHEEPVERTLLEAPTLWFRVKTVSASALLHVAASLNLLTILLTSEVVTESWEGGVVIVVAVALLIATLILVFTSTGAFRPPVAHRSDREWNINREWWKKRYDGARAMGALAGVFFALALLLLWRDGTTREGPIVVGQWAPALVVAVLVLLSLIGCTARHWRRDGRRPGTAHAEAWHGAGPGVFMFLGLLLAAFLSSALVLGFGAFLRTGRLVSKVDEGDPVFRTISEPQSATDIVIPPIYWFLGGAMVAVVALLLLLVVVMGVTFVLHGSGGITLPAIGPTEREFSEDIFRVRWTSGMMQRVEPVLGWMSGAAAVTLAAAAVLGLWAESGGPGSVPPVLGGWATDRRGASWEQALVLGTLAAAGAAIIASAVRSAREKTPDRPLGLLWDLTAWLPRSAHPFGPPCYSERVIPELAGRMERWLAVSGDRRVILATHSLGTVLGIAAIFQLARLKPDLVKRVRLLTFGTQVRPYFGRFLPEFFGPAVLGTPGVKAPSLRTRDPWAKKDIETGVPPDGSRSLVDLLAKPASGGGAAWVNLWRRTDYLGFPVASYNEFGNAYDMAVLEMEPGRYIAKVATHANYPLTVGYAEAIRKLLW